MAETPDQKRLRLQFRNAGNGFEAAPLPRAVPTEMPVENVDLGRTAATAPVPRGGSGLGDVVQDSRSRIRTNTEFRNQPVQGDLLAQRNPSERMGLGERSQEALKRAERFTANPGTLTTPQADSLARPRAVGSVFAAGLGASTTALNAANVYDQTDGDIGETAKQVAYDIPAAVGSTLGAVAGGVLGKRNPAAATTGMLAGGALGDTGGNQIASGADRLLGGDGLSPLQALEQQNAQPVDNEVFVSPANPDIPMLPEYGGVPVDARTGVPAATAQQEVLGEGPIVRDIPMPASMQQDPVITQPQVPGAAPVQQAPAQIAAPQGVERVELGGGGGGNVSFGNEGDSALALGRFERANQIRREGSLQDMQSRRQDRQVLDRRAMEANNAQIQSYYASGKASDILRAKALERENAGLAGRMAESAQSEQELGLGQLDAQVQRERTEAVGAGTRQLVALQRQELANARAEAEATRRQAGGREEFAQANAKTFDRDVEAILGEANPESGEVVVPQERRAMVAQRAPVFVQQREAAFREAVGALRQQAAAGDPNATAQLQAVEQDYDRFRQDVYRIGADGQTVEPRPVEEWNPVDRQLFFTDIKDQERRQGDIGDSALPETLGGIGGALAGAAAGSRMGGGGRGRLIGAAVGAGLGALGGGQAQRAVSGEQSRAAEGSRGASATLPANYDRVYTEGDAVVARLNDGSIVNLDNLLFENPGSDFLGGRGKKTNDFAPVIQATFDAAMAKARSQDPAAQQEAQDVLAAFGRRDELYQLLSETQRKRLPSRAGLGE